MKWSQQELKRKTGKLPGEQENAIHSSRRWF